jgi:hypothetical protein
MKVQYMRRRWVHVGTIGCLFLLPVSLFGVTAAHSDDSAGCFQKADPELSLRACTNIIRLAAETRETLALAFTHGGIAYATKGDYESAKAEFDLAVQYDPQPLS